MNVVVSWKKINLFENLIEEAFILTMDQFNKLQCSILTKIKAVKTLVQTGRYQRINMIIWNLSIICVSFERSVINIVFATSFNYRISFYRNEKQKELP